MGTLPNELIYKIISYTITNINDHNFYGMLTISILWYKIIKSLKIFCYANATEKKHIIFTTNYPINQLCYLKIYMNAYPTNKKGLTFCYDKIQSLLMLSISDFSRCKKCAMKPARSKKNIYGINKYGYRKWVRTSYI